jgi:hypothetical protein
MGDVRAFAAFLAVASPAQGRAVVRFGVRPWPAWAE